MKLQCLHVIFPSMEGALRKIPAMSKMSSYLLNHNNKELFHFFNGLVLVCKIYPTALIVSIAKGLGER